MTESSLDVRNHFAHAHSGFSTLRRSLGALLRETLQLKTLPRSAGQSRTSVRNYRFHDDGEPYLTGWMKDHLAYGFAVVANDITAIERELIAKLEPPLNLIGWRNPHRPHLRSLRDVCRDEARRAADAATAQSTRQSTRDEGED
jgi:hypothetical protein